MVERISEIYSLLVPLLDGRLIIPRSCVAEVVGFQTPSEMPGAPPWYLGMFAWGSRQIPLISFEGACGQTIPPLTGRTRVVVLFALGYAGGGRLLRHGVAGLPAARARQRRHPAAGSHQDLSRAHADHLAGAHDQRGAVDSRSRAHRRDDLRGNLSPRRVDPRTSSIVYRPDVDGLRALAVVRGGSLPCLPDTARRLPGRRRVLRHFRLPHHRHDPRRDPRRTFSLLDFYLRRARRILPALLTMLVGVSLLAMLVLMPDEMERFASQPHRRRRCSCPTWVLARDGVFRRGSHRQPAAAPVVAGRRGTVLPVVASRTHVVRAAVAQPYDRAGHCRHHPAVAGSQHRHGAPGRRPRAFICRSRASGSCSRARCSRLSRPHTRPDSPAPRWTRCRAHRGSTTSCHSPDSALIGGAILAGRTGWSQPALALPVTLGAALFIGAGPLALPNRTLFSWRPVVYVGLISYPLYLWHWPPLSFLHIMDLNEGTTGRLLRIGAVVFAAAAAVLTYHLVELPLRRRKDLRRLGARLLGGLSVAAVAGIVVAATADCRNEPRSITTLSIAQQRSAATIAARGSTVSPKSSTRTLSACAMTTRMNPRS